MAPSTQKQWTVQGKEGFDSLKYASDAAIPKIGENDVLVKCTPIRPPESPSQLC